MHMASPAKYPRLSRRTDVIRLDKSVTINTPLEEVFTFIGNFENESQWADEVVRTERTSEGPTGVGSTFADHVRFMGRSMKTSYEVVGYEPNSVITVKTSSGPVPFTATYSFDEVDGSTRLSIGADIEPRGLFKLAAPMIRRQLDRQWTRNFAHLKALLES
jgi:carbon monoxide dehydrogenase subunit G